MILAGDNGARYSEVLDGGTVDVAEEGSALVAVVGDVGGDGMTTSVKRTTEGVLLRSARHRANLLGDVDIVGQHHKQAAVTGAAGDAGDEIVPFIGCPDGIRG